MPTNRLFICTTRACRRTCASSAVSSIFSIASPNWREPRAERPTQVLSRHWKKPDPAPANKGKSTSRHQRLTPNAINAPRITRLMSSITPPDNNRLRRSRVLILGMHTAPLIGLSGGFDSGSELIPNRFSNFIGRFQNS